MGWTSIGFGEEKDGADVILCYFVDEFNGKIEDAHLDLVRG